MKKLVLVKPINPLFGRTTKGANGSIPPIALGILAALTPKDWRIEIIDENFKPFRYTDADLVGLTAFTSTAPRAYAIARLYRDNGVTTVMGGVHAAMRSQEALEHVDSIVVGEAEAVWPQVVADFEAGKLQRTYQGGLPDLKNMPIPRYDLFPRGCIGAVQTSRGCPMKCDFCSVTAFNGGQYRHRRVEEVLDELETIHKKVVFFLDDNIVGHGPKNVDRALALFEGMVSRALDTLWIGQASMNVADNPTILKAMAKSGCMMLLVGVEAEEPAALKELNKTVNLKPLSKSYREVFRKIHKHGIAVHGFFMYGMDVDTPESLRRRTEFITTCGVDSAQVSIVCPFPGTRLHQRMRQEGRLRFTQFPQDWAHYHFEEVALRPKLMPPDVLEEVVWEAYQNIHRPGAIVSRFSRALLATRSFPAALSALSNSVRLRRLQMRVRKNIQGEGAPA